MSNKTALITGGTAGIGKATAIGLAHKGVNVIITGSNYEKAMKAVDEIKRASSNPHIDAIVADLSSRKAIDDLINSVTVKYNSLDILINNIGYISPTRETTSDGYEKVFFLNYLLPYYLTYHLLPLLQASPKARVVNVTGGAYSMGIIDFKDLQAREQYKPFKALAQGKLALVQYSLLLAKKIRDTNVSVFVADPGVSKSGMGPKNVAWPWFFRAILMPLTATSPEKAAASSIYAATSPALDGKTGLFINARNKIITPAKKASIESEAVRLWEETQDLLETE